MDLKSQLTEHIKTAVEQTGLVKEVPNIKVEIPKNKENGDFSTNIAMVLTKIAKRNPREIAEEIVNAFDKEAANVTDISIAGPGFINFVMNTAQVANIIPTVLNQKENYGRGKKDHPQKILLEYVSANPTGDLHIAHARHGSFGDALANVLSFAGDEVTREFYINDAGSQIDNLALSIEARFLEALGHESYMPEDGYRGKDIEEIAKKLAEESPELLNTPKEDRIEMFKDYGVKYEIEKLKKDLKDYRVEFDHWFSERSLYENDEVNAVIEKLKENGHTFEKDGALWLRTTTFGDDKDRVLQKQSGDFTYFTPDIAYHNNKLNRGYDQLINIFGADHHGYIKRLKGSIDALGYNSDVLDLEIMQIVRLIEDGKEVKMSKRTGKSVTLRELMDEIGVDASRYFLAMRSIETPLDFDLDLAKSESSENPVYYAQYAHARISSILRQASEHQLTFDSNTDVTIIDKEEALNLIKKIADFPNIVQSAAKFREPHRITNYIQDLASSFHKFYNAEKVLTEDTEKTVAYLAMIEAARQTLNNALTLVGVSAPEKM